MHNYAYSRVPTVPCSFELVIGLVQIAAKKQEVTEGCCLLKKPSSLHLSINTEKELSAGFVSFEHPLSGCLIPYWHYCSYSS